MSSSISFHQVTKHIARVHGEQVFTGLLTVTNERGEIRSCTLVATKAHSQFELGLNWMRESLDLYGHRQPALFYTDNIGDKNFLERSFPSLREDVASVEKYGHLEPFDLPEAFLSNIFVKDTASSINDAVCTIIADLHDDEGFVVVGFDTEWNVGTGVNDRVWKHGKTAIIQITYESRVYILQVGSMSIVMST